MHCVHCTSHPPWCAVHLLRIKKKLAHSKRWNFNTIKMILRREIFLACIEGYAAFLYAFYLSGQHFAGSFTSPVVWCDILCACISESAAFLLCKGLKAKSCDFYATRERRNSCKFLPCSSSKNICYVFNFIKIFYIYKGNK